MFLKFISLSRFGSRQGPISLSICFLGFHVKTKPFPPTFPLLFGDKFVFEKTFPGKELV